MDTSLEIYCKDCGKDFTSNFHNQYCNACHSFIVMQLWKWEIFNWTLKAFKKCLIFVPPSLPHTQSQTCHSKLFPNLCFHTCPEERYWIAYPKTKHIDLILGFFLWNRQPWFRCRVRSLAGGRAVGMSVITSWDILNFITLFQSSVCSVCEFFWRYKSVLWRMLARACCGKQDKIRTRLIGTLKEEHFCVLTFFSPTLVLRTYWKKTLPNIWWEAKKSILIELSEIYSTLGPANKFSCL